MTRPIARAFALLLPVWAPVLVSLTGCTPTPTILPTNDLNRPTDIAFMCLGAFEVTAPDGTPTGTFDVSGRPMSVCHPPPEADQKAAQPAVSMQNRTFAFVPNSASGDLTVVDADSWKLVDLNRATGGYGRVPLGTLPEQISTTTDGCRLVSANRGSCDLSLVDPSALLAPAFAAQYNNAGAGTIVNVPAGSPIQTIVPRVEDGSPLGAAPYEAVFLPQDTSQINTCPGAGGSTATPWRALVTFPSCDLVAIVDLPTGKIETSAKIVADGNSVKLQPAGKSPQCFADCGAGRAIGPADGGVPDAGMPDPDAGADGGGADATAPAAPGATRGTYNPTGIAIAPTADHAWISLANHPAVLSFGLTPSAITEPQQAVPLHENAQGSNRIRLGVDPYGVKTKGQGLPGRFVGDNAGRNYLYVIARDGSLRIIDVFTPGSETECETNFDALDPQLPAPDPTQPRDKVPVDAGQRCIPYGSVKRRPYSRDTAGLRFPTFPVDVAAADMGRVNGDNGDRREDTVAGGYAWVLTANGQIFLVNIDPVQRSIKAVVHQGQNVLFDPDPASVAMYEQNGFTYKNDPTMANLGVLEPPPFPNRPRDRNFLSYSASLDPTLGLVRVDIPPIALATGPYIEPLWTQGTEANATAVDVKARQTYVFFPDRDGAIAQGWDITWQGTLVSPRYSGVLRGNVLRDGGGGFCTAGVLAGDIVQLNGCTADTQCPLGMLCRRDSTVDQVEGGLTVTGICVSANVEGEVPPQCLEYRSSLRRYEITNATNTQLTLKPHLDEIIRSSLTPCQLSGSAGTSGAAGTGGATGAAGMGGGGAGGAGGGGGTGGAGGTGGGAGAAGSGGAPLPVNDCADPIDSSTLTHFQCVELAGEHRCLNPCTKQQDCRKGRVCLRCGGDADCASGTTCRSDGLCHHPAPDCVVDGDCQSGESCVQKKCVRKCAVDGDCQSGEGCVKEECVLKSYCADGPPLGFDQCFPQLTPYQVNANASFTVTGTNAGSFASGVEVRKDPNDPMSPLQCAPIEGRDPRLISRIPLRPTPGAPVSSIVCDPAKTFPTRRTDDPQADGYYIDRFDPRLAPVINTNGYADQIPVQTPVGPLKITQESTQLLDWMNTWIADVNQPNACIYLGGPITSDDSSTADPTARPARPQHVRARFRNTQIAFVLANLDRGPPGASISHFEVHGGYRPQFVVMPTTVEISAPARLVLGPVDSNQKAEVTTGPAPFFFVVDQRRLGRGQGGGPTRGQIVRVNPFGLQANGFLPLYEDYTRSGQLFPIQ